MLRVWEEDVVDEVHFDHEQVEKFRLRRKIGVNVILSESRVVHHEIVDFSLRLIVEE